MTDLTAPTSVRKEVTVEASAERCFHVFTEGFTTWWPASHHIGEAELDRGVIEPGVGGRWYEVGVDGTECEWGTVLAWEPPHRLVLDWQLSSSWTYDPELHTEVEVTFTAIGPGRTAVALEHRNLDRFGEAQGEMVATFGSEGGWTGLLASFAAAAGASEATPAS